MVASPATPKDTERPHGAPRSVDNHGNAGPLDVMAHHAATDSVRHHRLATPATRPRTARGATGSVAPRRPLARRTAS